MITDNQIERRCRYRLAKHGLIVHKVKDHYGPMYYACYGDDDPPEWQRHYMYLDELLDFATVLKEKESDYRDDRKTHHG